MNKQKTFVQLALENGAQLAPICVHFPQEVKNNGVFNPSVFNDKDCLYVNLRTCNYTLFHSEDASTPLDNSPFNRQTFHILGENQDVKVTTNIFCYLETSNLKPLFTNTICTEDFDKPPQWVFSGLEDARLVKWSDKFYLCGTRRDTESTGIGRMELSEMEVKYGFPKELKRIRMPAPNNENTYCEKNWMPILDHPFHFVRWSNPADIVYYNPSNGSTTTVVRGHENKDLSTQLRGGSQVIKWDDGYLAMVHQVHSTYVNGKYDHEYKQQFIFWDSNWNIVKYSDQFTMLGAKIEFASGLTTIDNDVVITFGHQDSTSFVVKVSTEFIRGLLHE